MRDALLTVCLSLLFLCGMGEVGVEYFDVFEDHLGSIDPYEKGSSRLLTPLTFKEPFCSFFDNRSPQMQPDLRNCTWYREKSCCRQEELESIFKKVKPLQGASESCMRHLNYMICWVCDPLQYNFYLNGWKRLKMCGSFCDAVLEACRYAKLKGDYVGVLYPSGAEFCKSRRFDVAINDKNCFSYSGIKTRDAWKQKLFSSANSLRFADKMRTASALQTFFIFFGLKIWTRV